MVKFRTKGLSTLNEVSTLNPKKSPASNLHGLRFFSN